MEKIKFKLLIIISLFIYAVSRAIQLAMQIRSPLPCSHALPYGRICSHINPGQVTALRFYSDTVSHVSSDGRMRTVDRKLCGRCRDPM